jgi:anti-sigma B factor antagonist
MGMPVSLRIETAELEPGIVVIKLAGSVMRGPESKEIESLVPQFLAAGRRNVIFDLSEVKRLDSTGIGRFIFSLNKVSAAGDRLAMAGAEGYVRDVFRVTRLDTVFRFYPTAQSAAEALGAK